jgi:ABC-type transporter lipoprotein component MlaA
MMKETQPWWYVGPCVGQYLKRFVRQGGGGVMDTYGLNLSPRTSLPCLAGSTTREGIERMSDGIPDLQMEHNALKMRNAAISEN